MFAPATYAARRRRLADSVSTGLIVLLGNDNAPMNYGGNYYRFLQDGSFLYYAGLNEPGLAITIDADSGDAVLYGHDPSMDDVVWEGPLSGITDRASLAGISETAPSEDLGGAIAQAKEQGRPIHVLPPYRGEHSLKLGKLQNVTPYEIAPSKALIEAVVAQRLVKSEEEVVELDKAVALSAKMHLTAMRMAQPGRSETEVAAAMESIAVAAGSHPSFPIILSRRGEVLHNHPTDYVLQQGDLMLADGGAHAPGSRYAGDITRVSPVGGHFSERQRTLYDIVLKAQTEAIEACKPGVPFREVHALACTIIADGLTGIGIMKGDPAEAVAAGAHALFMPHGLGHAMGLDVHDMEALGEDHVGYDREFRRSEQFGTAYLRFARRLEIGHVMTVEPGLYLIGALADMWRSEGKHANFIDYDEFDGWRDFGGIRIEDDILVTEDSCRILGPGIPKEPGDVEAVVQSGLE